MTASASWCTADDGCRLAYASIGPEGAPTLVLSNSLGTDRRLWAAQIAPLAREHRVLAYDTRGHGASDAPAGEYTIERLGRDVVTLLDHVGVPRSDVCGISIGGLTALWLAIHVPDRVGRVVLANTAARIGSVASWTERMQAVDEGGLPAIVDQTMGRWFTEGFRATHATTVAAVRGMFLATPAAGYLGCCAALRDADLREDAARVAVPALVIAGTLDPATPAADGAWLAARITGASLLELDAAHLSNIERADAFTEAVRTFLA